MAYNFSNATLQSLKDVYTDCGKLVRALEEYNSGNPAPSVNLNRFSATEIQTLLADAKTAITTLDGLVNT